MHSTYYHTNSAGQTIITATPLTHKLIAESLKNLTATRQPCITDATGKCVPVNAVQFINTISREFVKLPPNALIHICMDIGNKHVCENVPANEFVSLIWGNNKLQEVSPAEFEHHCAPNLNTPAIGKLYTEMANTSKGLGMTHIHASCTINDQRFGTIITPTALLELTKKYQ
jgi:hypothetical protein